ncbi:hypothetical protein PIB30_019621 [Stylosanthes scabra]|uniref:Uncharacterized protein n=1 Tax=Stylosanthes scabra TaxID=79078 RepID=A0ABU6R8J2_9FABA|nr:hypothetical protein [Stylosanthes scabra]
MEDVKASRLLKCGKKELPIKYLEIPRWKPDIQKIEKRLKMWKGKLFTKSGKLVLIKPGYAMDEVGFCPNTKKVGWVRCRMVDSCNNVERGGVDVFGAKDYKGEEAVLKDYFLGCSYWLRTKNALLMTVDSGMDWYGYGVLTGEDPFVDGKRKN